MSPARRTYQGRRLSPCSASKRESVAMPNFGEYTPTLFKIFAAVV